MRFEVRLRQRDKEIELEREREREREREIAPSEKVPLRQGLFQVPSSISAL